MYASTLSIRGKSGHSVTNVFIPKLSPVTPPLLITHLTGHLLTNFFFVLLYPSPFPQTFSVAIVPPLLYFSMIQKHKHTHAHRPTHSAMPVFLVNRIKFNSGWDLVSWPERNTKWKGKRPKKKKENSPRPNYLRKPPRVQFLTQKDFPLGISSQLVDQKSI